MPRLAAFVPLILSLRKTKSISRKLLPTLLPPTILLTLQTPITLPPTRALQTLPIWNMKAATPISRQPDPLYHLHSQYKSYLG